MRIAGSIMLFLIALWMFGLYVSGNHGHIMFRPWMLEDWIIWGLILFCLIGASLLLRRGGFTRPKM